MKYNVFHIILIFFVIFTYNAAADPISGDPVIEKVYTEALSWLEDQIVPNRIVEEPSPSRRKLILSYSIEESDPAYRYLARRSFLYDNAVAAIAFTMAGSYRSAESLLSAMARLVRSDGSLWFSYNTHNSWPDEDDYEGAVIRSGALAWAGYAASYYVSVREQEEPGFSVNDTLGRKYMEMAKSVAGYLLSLQITDENDLRYGLVTGGKGTYTPVYSDKGNIEEIYDYDSVGWVSVEHNIDIYFLFKSIGNISGDDFYRKKAELVKKAILKSLWDRKNGQFFRGIKIDGKKDTALPLDGASWGALFLASIGEKGKMKRALLSAENNFRTEKGNYNGYSPYFDEPVYDDINLSRHILGGAGDTRWRDINVVWSEGSLGVAAAWIRGGEYEKGKDIIKSMTLMSAEGGLIYSSENLPYIFSNYPSVAGSGWFVIACELYKNPENIFWRE